VHERSQRARSARALTSERRKELEEEGEERSGTDLLLQLLELLLVHPFLLQDSDGTFLDRSL